MSAPNTVLRPGRGRGAAARRPSRPRSPTPSRPSPPRPTSPRSRQARLAHAGDRTPLALANREIGALPPQAKAEAGKRVGQARGRSSGARRRGRPSSRPSATRACSSRRPSTSRCRSTAGPVGARHPLTTLRSASSDIFVAMGWEVAEGPEVEAEWLNFDALNFGPDHPARTMQDTFFVDPAEAGVVLRTHTSPVQVRALLDARAADLRRLPGQGLPHRRVRRDPLAGLPPDRGPGRGQGHHDGPPQGHPRPLRRRRCSATASRPGCGPSSSPSPSRPPRSTCSASSAAALGQRPGQPCRTCKARAGSSGAAGRGQPAGARACGVDPEVYSGFAFGMGVDRTLMFRNGVEDMRDMIEGDVRFSSHSGWRSNTYWNE